MQSGNKYINCLLLITLLLSSSVQAMEKKDFSRLAVKNIYKTIPLDRDSFTLVNGGNISPTNPVLYSNNENEFQEYSCTQSAVFEIHALANRMALIKVAVCPYSNLNRKMMDEMEKSFNKSFTNIATNTKLNAMQLEETGYIFTSNSLDDGADVYSFPVIVIGHGIIFIKTLVLYPPDNSHAFVIQLNSDVLCDAIKDHRLCEKNQQALLDILLNVVDSYMANK